MKNIIDITNLLSADLKSRYAVNDLLLPMLSLQLEVLLMNIIM